MNILYTEFLVSQLEISQLRRHSKRDFVAMFKCVLHTNDHTCRDFHWKCLQNELIDKSVSECTDLIVKYMNQFFCYLTIPKQYMQRIINIYGQYDYHLYSDVNMHTIMRNKNVKIRGVDTSPRDSNVLNIFHVWNVSENRQEYKDQYFGPMSEANKKDFVNIYSGLTHKMFDHLESYEQDFIKHEQDIEQFLQWALHNLCDSNKELLDSLLNWLAIKLQKPYYRHDYDLYILYNNEDCSWLNMYIEFFGSYTSYVENKRLSLDQLKNKLLCVTALDTLQESDRCAIYSANTSLFHKLSYLNHMILTKENTTMCFLKKHLIIRQTRVEEFTFDKNYFYKDSFKRAMFYFFHTIENKTIKYFGYSLLLLNSAQQWIMCCLMRTYTVLQNELDDLYTKVENSTGRIIQTNGYFDSNWIGQVKEHTLYNRYRHEIQMPLERNSFFESIKYIIKSVQQLKTSNGTYLLFPSYNYCLMEFITSTSIKIQPCVHHIIMNIQRVQKSNHVSQEIDKLPMKSIPQKIKYQDNVEKIGNLTFHNLIPRPTLSRDARREVLEAEPHTSNVSPPGEVLCTSSELRGVYTSNLCTSKVPQPVDPIMLDIEMDESQQTPLEVEHLASLSGSRLEMGSHMNEIDIDFPDIDFLDFFK